MLAAAGESGRVRVPQLHEHLCSSKVLVMEWIAGAKITDVEALTRQVGSGLRVCGLWRVGGVWRVGGGYIHDYLRSEGVARNSSIADTLLPMSVKSSGQGGGGGSGGVRAVGLQLPAPMKEGGRRRHPDGTEPR